MPMNVGRAQSRPFDVRSPDHFGVSTKHHQARVKLSPYFPLPSAHCLLLLFLVSVIGSFQLKIVWFPFWEL